MSAMTTERTLLAGYDIEHMLPALCDFKSNENECYGCSEPTLSWRGEVAGYDMDISINCSDATLLWGGKAYVMSVCGVVLDRISVLPRFNTREDAYVALMLKVDSRISKMERSKITNSFPFVG